MIEPDDFGFYEKLNVTPPTHCPDCRRQRRLSWRNDYVFYNRECDLCRRKIISIYSPDNLQVIYCNKCWWSDAWDPKEYAQDFDFNRPFFDQFSEFRQKIPTLALVNDNGSGSENCEYVQNVQYSRNCYMAMVAWKIEDCMYFSYGADAKGAVDCMGIFGTSDGIYEALYSEKCFGSRYIQNCTSLINCSLCYDCHGCDSCFMSVGLRNKKYYFKNQEYSKEEYEKIVKEYKLNTYSGTEKALLEFNEFALTQPHKYSFLLNCATSTGNNLVNSKNAFSVFHVRRAEDCKYLENGDTEKDSHDLCVGGELEQCYEGLTPDHSRKALFTNYTWKSSDVLYTDFCMSCADCFGCVGLKHAKYSIFNKEYSKTEYQSLKENIIEHMKKTGEWCEFFPMKYSPFAYNESMAELSFPLLEEETKKKGLRFQENIQQTRGKTTLVEIPDAIEDVSDLITQEILGCVECHRNYKIIVDELNFYKKWRIPVPHKCFFCRLKRRFELRGPSTLWYRSCMCKQEGHDHTADCGNEFETPYAPGRPEIIYCESCYQKEVI